MLEAKREQLETCVADLMGVNAEVQYAVLIDAASATCISSSFREDVIDESVFAAELIRLSDAARNTIKVLQPDEKEAVFKQEVTPPVARIDHIHIKLHNRKLIVLPDTNTGLLLAAILMENAMIGLALLDMSKTMAKIQEIVR